MTPNTSKKNVSDHEMQDMYLKVKQSRGIRKVNIKDLSTYNFRKNFRA